MECLTCKHQMKFVRGVVLWCDRCGTVCAADDSPDKAWEPSLIGRVQSLITRQHLGLDPPDWEARRIAESVGLNAMLAEREKYRIAEREK